MSFPLRPTLPKSFLFSSASSPSSSSNPLPPHLVRNPFKAKKPWPPDFTQLNPKYQFYLERKYRRRTQLKYARPRWMKATKLVQWGTIGFVLVYGVLFLDWNTEETPFKNIRKTFHEKLDAIWTNPELREYRKRTDERSR